MPNVKRAKGEDVQADTRVNIPEINANVTPTAPKAPNASGGAPKLDTSPAITIEKPANPSLTRDNRYAEFDDIAKAYEQGVRNAYGLAKPPGQRAQPWRAEQAQTNLGRQYREKLDSESLVSAPVPPWTIAQVREAEPQFISAIKDRLWEMYTNASDEEKNSDFFQGIRQNPEYAAATIVRRMLMNSQQRDVWMTGEAAPKLGEAIRNSLQMSNAWRWLNYIQGNQAKPLSAPPVTPPRAAEGGLNAVTALRKARQ